MASYVLAGAGAIVSSDSAATPTGVSQPAHRMTFRNAGAAPCSTQPIAGERKLLLAKGSLLWVTPLNVRQVTVKLMRRRREPQLEDAFIEHPLGALAALAFCVLIASCFFSIFVSKLWAIALGLPVGIVMWLMSAASIAKDPDNPDNQWWE